MPTKKIDAACRSFLKMCHILDELLKLKQGRSSSNRVSDLLREHMQLHQSYYGTTWIKPKHHFAFHNVLSLRDDKVWLDCFVHERKHQIVKRAGTTIKSTSSYESSVLGRVLLEQWRQLQGCSLGDVLLGRSTVDEIVSSSFGEPARAAKSLQYAGLVIGVGDMILVRGSPSAYIVKSCVFLESTSRLLLIVGLLVTVSATSAYSVYRTGDELQGVLLDGSLEVSLPYCWTWSGDDEVVILHAVA